MLIHRLAENEAAAATLWYRDIDPELADRFSDALAATLEEVGIQPDRFAPDADGDRKRLVKGFPYAVIYCEQETYWSVIAVSHTSRRPRYWARRLNRP